MIKFIKKDEAFPKKSVLLFIHGFTGSEKSWLKTNKDEIRIPDYLMEDSVISTKYDFALFSYFSELSDVLIKIRSIFFIVKYKINLKIDKIARILQSDVKAKLKSYDNIIIIAHSMGGLIAKTFILDIIEKDKTEQIESKIKGFISLAVPHNGTNLANLGSILFDNPQIENLQPLELFINKLTNRWLVCSKLPPTAYFECAYDNVVRETSALGYEIRDVTHEVVEHDHNSILKPIQDDTIIQLIKDCINKFENSNSIDTYLSLINKFNLENTASDGQARINSYIITHDNKEFRNGKFSILKRKAKYSLTIMGVGITNINIDELKVYIKKGISVRLLMMNPNILFNKFEFKNTESSTKEYDFLNAYDMMLKNGHIDKFYDRKEYFNEIGSSFSRLKDFVQSKSEKEANHGSIEMRVFNSFIPMSFTSINEFNISGDNEYEKEFITEFSLPYSTKRILMQVSNNLDEVIYSSFLDSMNCLWDVSSDVSIININNNLI